MQSDQSLQLVDVRSRAEWLKGHLPAAISLPLLDLDPKKQVINPARPNLAYCHEGYRATTAASILMRESDGNVCILIDGVEGGWPQACLSKCPKAGSFDGGSSVTPQPPLSQKRSVGMSMIEFHPICRITG